MCVRQPSWCECECDEEQPTVDSVDDSDSVGDGMTISISAASASKMSLGFTRHRSVVRSNNNTGLSHSLGQNLSAMWHGLDSDAAVGLKTDNLPSFFRC